MKLSHGESSKQLLNIIQSWCLFITFHNKGSSNYPSISSFILSFVMEERSLHINIFSADLVLYRPELHVPGT